MRFMIVANCWRRRRRLDGTPAVVQGALSAQIATSCTMPNNPPGCGGTPGSAAATLVALLDADHDCGISMTELENNPIVQNLFCDRRHARGPEGDVGRRGDHGGLADVHAGIGASVR